jgi:hypothetical protein
LGYYELQAGRVPVSRQLQEWAVWCGSGLAIGCYFSGMGHGQMSVFQRYSLLLLLAMAVSFKCQGAIIGWHGDLMAMEVKLRVKGVAPSW